jgi:ABC-type transport system involved in cytochrome bd biosynthesis fused ATPase/permease subunit
MSAVIGALLVNGKAGSPGPAGSALRPGGLFVFVTLFMPRVSSGWQSLKLRAHQASRRNITTGRGADMNLPTDIASTLLYLDGVSVSFDGFRAINNLSLTLDVGEMRAIIGPNGAGKTTMMDIITGKTRADEGEVFFDHGRVDLVPMTRPISLRWALAKFQKPPCLKAIRWKTTFCLP